MMGIIKDKRTQSSKMAQWIKHCPDIRVEGGKKNPESHLLTTIHPPDTYTSAHSPIHHTHIHREGEQETQTGTERVIKS